MRFVDGILQDQIAPTNFSSPIEYGGTACIDKDTYIIASQHYVMLHLIYKNNIVDSCTVKSLHFNDDSYWCNGIVISDDHYTVYVLLYDRKGNIIIEQVKIDLINKIFIDHHTAAMKLPSGHKFYLTEMDILWKRYDTLLNKILIPDHFFTNSSLLNKLNNISLGMPYFKYPPSITRVGTKLIIGVNHVNSIGVLHTHIWDYCTKEDFYTNWLTTIKDADETFISQWRSKIKNNFVLYDKALEITELVFPTVNTDTGDLPVKPSKLNPDISGNTDTDTFYKYVPEWYEEPAQPLTYMEGEWWRSERVFRFQQSVGNCEGATVCVDCGNLDSCDSDILVPLFDGDDPKGEVREIDRIRCRTLLRHPFLTSSLIVVDILTGNIEGITNIGSSSLGVASSTDPDYIISGLISYNTNVHVILTKLNKYIPNSPLMWGNDPLSADDYNVEPVEYPLKRVLYWYGKNHLPWLLNEDGSLPAIDGELFFDKRYYNVYSMYTDLINNGTVDTPVNQPLNVSTLKLTSAPILNVNPYQQLSISDIDNSAILVSKTNIWKYKTTSYEFVTYYENIEIGRGQDINVGPVLEDVQKTVKVRMYNLDYTKLTMNNISIKIISSFDYPYYEFVNFGNSVNNIKSFNSPSPLTFNNYIEFYITVKSSLSQLTPKPVLLEVNFNLI